jgi:hypothetical protein
MKTESKMAALFVFNGDPVCFIHVLLDDMSGHPSMSAYLGRGYRVITF